MRLERLDSPEPPAWLVARPIAHRGLRFALDGVAENSVAAAEAAIARNYAIECDLELSRDAEAVVFHDDSLDRLTQASGRVGAYSLRELTDLTLAGGACRIPSLRTFLAAVDGRVPLIIEIKSRFDGDFRLAARALEALANYPGPAALKSFDPTVLAFLRARRASRPLGLVAQAEYAADEWPQLKPAQRRLLAALADFPAARPDFLSFRASDLPHAAPTLCRAGLGLPVMTWTVRGPAERAQALRWADQIVFEGFEP
ncbi:glycerophosphodiester phosphodiesterase family protein [Methylocella sp.]|uniref:glycerophosphodiester phosphodiesterase family protein n=1 Tax=Methylocella sp. TaxID=1978226 RepID=UPI003782FE5F